MRRLLMLGFFLALAASSGCDALQRDGAEVMRLILDFSSLQGTENGVVPDGCATSIETVFLNVNGREFRKDVSSDTVLFDVAGLRRGVLRAQATVLSNTGDTLFVGEDSRTANETDFGTVDIHLDKVRPVLQICPDTLTLFRENDYGGTISIWNRGSQLTGMLADTLLWRAVEPRVCIRESCVFIEPDEGVAVVPQPYEVFIGGGFTAPEAIFEIPFESRFGRTQIYVRIASASIGK